MLHALAQFRGRTAAFFFAHLVEPLDGLLQRGGHVLLEFVRGIARLGGIQRARQLQHGVEVRLRAHAELLRRLAKCSQVSADQLAIDRERRSARALQAESDLDVSAMQALLQHPPHLHLHRIQLARDPQVQIQEAMVHRLQAERQA